ncbi:HIT domain-containing protein [Microbacterium sp. 77mftsu3.1]|nr:HIT domain-containing protein [Microbacterium sp. 77mftsu3.1]
MTARRSLTGMNDDACSFCRNIAEDGFDVVARGERVLAVLDRHPINRGHVLVIPLRHAPDLASLTSDEVIELALVAQAADRAIRDVLAATTTGTNLVMSNGEDADQGTPHAHLHVIPRQPGDGYEFREDATRYPLAPLSDGERAALQSGMNPSTPRLTL